MATQDEREDLVAALRSRNMRVTPQREQVLAAVRRLGHATPDEISGAVSDVDVTTVYRTLQVLEEVGLVAHAHLDHGAPAYQPADDVHLHVVCHGCGAVIEAPAGLGETIADRLRDERDFAVDLGHLTIFGRCGNCEAGDVPVSAHIHSEHSHDARDHDAPDHAATQS